MMYRRPMTHTKIQNLDSTRDSAFVALSCFNKPTRPFNIFCLHSHRKIFGRLRSMKLLQAKYDEF